MTLSMRPAAAAITTRLIGVSRPPAAPEALLRKRGLEAEPAA